MSIALAQEACIIPRSTPSVLIELRGVSTPLDYAAAVLEGNPDAGFICDDRDVLAVLETRGVWTAQPVVDKEAAESIVEMPSQRVVFVENADVNGYTNAAATCKLLAHQLLLQHSGSLNFEETGAQWLLCNGVLSGYDGKQAIVIALIPM